MGKMVMLLVLSRFVSLILTMLSCSRSHRRGCSLVSATLGWSRSRAATPRALLRPLGWSRFSLGA